jgi:hypothetical protein
VSHTREGGVLGFFARPRVAVQFTVGDPTDASLPPSPTPRPAKTAEARTVSEKADETTDPLDALIAAAEMVETGNASALTGRASTGAGDAPAATQPEIDGVGNVEFARMLLDIAARKAAERGVDLPAAAELPNLDSSAGAEPAVAAPTAEPVAHAMPAKVISAVKAAAVSKAAEQQAQAQTAQAQSATRSVEPIEFEQLVPAVATPVAPEKPKAVRVVKPKTAKVGKRAKSAAETATVEIAQPVADAQPVDARIETASDAVTAAPGVTATNTATKTAARTTTAKKATPAKAPARTTATKTAKATKASKAATKTETAAAVQAKIAAVGQSLRAELSIADLHESDELLTLRRRLSELGVPFDRIPTDAPHRYAAVEQLVHALPSAAPLPEADGQLIVLAGPSAQVAATAELLIKRMSLLPWQVWAHHCPGIAALPDREIRDAAHAATVAAHVRHDTGEQKPQPPQNTLVVIGLDEFESEQLHGGTTAAANIRALGPDAFWLHVDATRKASDTAALVRELGNPTALVVTGAARTASPASVWELNVPVALLDGRPATASAWAVLLLDKLAEAAA